MTEIYNRPDEMATRRRLRREMPRSEVLLWTRMRGKQVLGLKFRRQYSVGPYVLDFFCPERKLAIEIDGDSHYTPEARRSDAQRQRYVESFGIRFVRFTNEEIRTNLEGVIEAIVVATRANPPDSPGLGFGAVHDVGAEEPPCIPPS